MTLAEDDVDCEIARGIVADYFAITAIELAAEKARTPQDIGKINTLNTRLRRLHSEKVALAPNRIFLIRKAFHLYAKILREVNQ